MISAAPVRDRVVHHALCNIIEPIFESSFIDHSYANRKNKGTHKAILKYQEYARQYPYVIKCDIRKCKKTADPQMAHLLFADTPAIAPKAQRAIFCLGTDKQQDIKTKFTD